MGNIGEDQKEYEFEPIEAPAEMPEPAPVAPAAPAVPEREPEKVPA